jgi:pyrroline-5-carboxylate reductase
MKVLVLGAGKMVEAILSGLMKSYDLSNFEIFSPSGTSAKKLAQKVGAKVVLDLSTAKDFDWILLGCKPQQLVVASELLNNSLREKIFVSVLAALSEEKQLKVLDAKKLIRLMPNLPVEFNEGVCLLSSASSHESLTFFEKIFSTLGQAIIVKEAELDELTLLTGSGPAFFYEFARYLAGTFESLDEQKREDLIRLVLIGAAESLKRSSSSLEQLTNAVTSKGGVTIAALESWRSQSLEKFIEKGVDAGKSRMKSIMESLTN